MRIQALFPLLIGSAVLSVGCEDSSTNCDTIAVSSVIVTVENDLGEPLDDALVTFTVDGGVPGSCFATGTPGEFSCGVEETGLFEVSASADEHGSESLDVDVGADACHVIPEMVSLTLPALG